MSTHTHTPDVIVDLKSPPLTVRQAALRLGVSVVHCYQMCAERQIGHFRIGKCVRITEKDLADFIARNTVAPEPPDDAA